MTSRIYSGLAYLRRRAKPYPRSTQRQKVSARMYGKLGSPRPAKRDSQSGPKSSIIVSNEYDTTSPTNTGPDEGNMALGPAMVENNSGPEFSRTSNVIGNANLTSLVSVQSTSVAIEKTSTFTFTSTITSSSTTSSSDFTPVSTTYSISSSTSSTSYSLATSATSSVSTSSTSISSQKVESTVPKVTPLSTSLATTNPVAMAMSTLAPAPTLLLTSLSDLPLVIESPTSTVPKSMSLLVATSSSTEAHYPTYKAMTPKPSASVAPTKDSEVTPIASSSMGATGKASLIIGVVLFLGAIFMMLQVYLNKRRKSVTGDKLSDNEKGSPPSMGTNVAMASPTVPPKSNPMSNNNQMNQGSGKNQISVTLANEKPSSLSVATSTSNPFGNHAEIISDTNKAIGVNVNEKAGAVASGGQAAPRLARVASKQGPRSQNAMRQGPTGGPPGSAHAGFANPSMNSGGPSPMNINTTHNGPNGPVPSVYRVQIDFTPSMSDELELRAGQLIRVLHEYDDGWAMCMRLDCSQQGVCPRTCLSTRPVKPRSPSGGPRGPPPAMNVPMTPNGRPHSKTRRNSNGQPANGHMGHPVMRPNQSQDPRSMSAHGQQQQKSYASHDPTAPTRSNLRAGGPYESKDAEFPLPLTISPRVSSDNTPSRVASPVQMGVARDSPSFIPSSQSPKSQTSISAKCVPDKASPGPVGTVHDYFSLDKPAPTHVGASAPIDAGKQDVVQNQSYQTANSNTVGGSSAQASYRPLDLLHERSVPGQAL